MRAGNRDAARRVTSFMRRMLPLIPLMLLAACGRQDDDAAQQPGVVANIMDEALPNAQQPPAPANAITPVEPDPVIETPEQSAPPGLIPASLQGRWTGIDARCGDRSEALELTIAPDRLIFHESVGTVRTVREGAGERLAVDAAFTGEGQSWTRTLDLKPSADGSLLTIVNDGTAVTRKRC